MMSWLPLYHDMGLVGFLAIPMTKGVNLVQAAPQDFLAHPGNWMQWLSDYGCTATAGPNFSWVLTIAVILFAFSTMISWSYYGMQGWVYLFGKGKYTDLVYKILFLIFVVIGASISLGAVIDFSDAMIFAMVVPNIIGVLLLTPVVNKELKRYMNAINKKDVAIEEGATDFTEHL